MHARIDRPRSDRVEADPLFCVARLRVIASRPPFVIIGWDAFNPEMNVPPLPTSRMRRLRPSFCASTAY
jgi:hypothetical protein